MFGKRNSMAVLVPEYREEDIRIPVMVTIVVLLVVAAPLVSWILKINKEGIRSTDITKYNNLIETVAGDVKTVDAMLRNDAAELAAITSTRKAPSVTLIVPEVVIVEERANKRTEASPLKIHLEGIYWSPANPLVGIGGETYRVGDVIQGYEIVKIGKTSVQFQHGDGTIVVKDMYENLLHSQK